jgi:Lrp/AsnC family transcriptional regulator, leucine-responsive regulatory protein
MDDLDLAIVANLSQKGRMSWAELAQEVGLSAPGLLDRVRRLEEKKIIRGYRAVVDPHNVGLSLTAFVSVSLDKPSHRAGFLKRIKQLPEVQECHHVSGEDDYLIKLRCQDTRHLDQVLSLGLKSWPGVARTHITIVLATEKETSELPLPHPARTRGISA